MEEINEVLTVKEFKKKFNITERMWKPENKEETLKWISNFYAFEEVGNTVSKKFILTEKYSDYEPPEKKKSKEAKMKIYSQELEDEIRKHPYHIYKTLTCNVVLTDKTKTCNHKFGTSYGYVREIMKNDPRFKKTGTIWCERFYYPVDGEHFRPLTEEELEGLKAIRSEVYNDDKWNEQEEDILFAYKNGEIERSEYAEKISALSLNKYGEYMDKFTKQYGFTPWKANIYEVVAWEDK